jgi:homoserine kinase
MPAPAFRAAPVRVRVPATSANLGPGFDSFGLALGRYDDVVVRVTDGGLRVDIAGEGASSLPRDESHLVVRALRAGFDLLGGQPRGMEVVCANRIPHRRGLGSSAAAIVCGLVAARTLTVGGAERIADQTLLEVAVAMEGHPDNVAACLYGGFTLAWTANGRPQALRLDPSPEVVPLLFVSKDELSTEKARALLPDVVPHVDAVANAARAALLVQALTGRPDLLFEATEDRLHQDYRAPAMPGSHELVRRLRAAGLPAVVSGAGPTVLVLATADALDRAAPGVSGASTWGSAAEPAGERWLVERPGVATGGAAVVPLDG